MRTADRSLRRPLRLGMVGGGLGSHIGETHRQAARRVARLWPGHLEGFIDAFANLYSDMAEAILARRDGVAADPLAGTFPTVEDGVLGVKFVEAAVESNAQGGRWVDATL